MPVGGPRRRKKVQSPSATSADALPEISEEDESDAEGTWTQVPSFEEKRDVDMTSESETESVWKNQGELDAAQYLTTLYNHLMLNQQLTPEMAYSTMLEKMEDDAQLRMFHKWDSMGRHA